MPPNHSSPIHLALIREILLPAIASGIILKATAGQALTLENLPSLVSAGAEVCLVDDQRRLAVVTAVDNDRQGMRMLPSFKQIRADGQLIKFYLWDQEVKALAVGGYQPATLKLSDELHEVQMHRRGYIDRVATGRLLGLFDDRMIQA